MGLRLLRSRAVFGCVLALLLWGCSHSSDPNRSAVGPTQGGAAGKGDEAPAAGTRKLQITSAAVLRVGFGEHSNVAGRLVDQDAKPVSDARVSFALVGRAQDSSIEALDVITDADGAFENTLSAGKAAATFRVRISAEGASDTSVDVAVSDAGFGTLVVTASYAGARMVTQRSVFAQADVDCEHAKRMPGDPMATFGATESTARLPALPAGTHYAVTAVAEGEPGTVVAHGCVDDVLVDRNAERPVVIAFEDAPLMHSGDFDLVAELDSSVPAIALASVLRRADEVLVLGDTPGQPAPADAEGTFLLDSLDSVLRGDEFAAAPGALMLADAIAGDRANMPADARPDHSLQALLDINDEGPLAAGSLMAMYTQAGIARLRVRAALALGDAIACNPMRVEALPSEAGADAVALDLDAPHATTMASYVAGQDAIELSSLSFRAQLGALSAQVMRAVASTQAGRQGEAIQAELGCSTLGEWLGKQSYPDAPACDDDCLSATCERATARLLGAAETALLALDDTRPLLSLSGTFALDDADGDLLAERLSGDMIDGAWLPAEDGERSDALHGSASATTTPVPP